MAVSLHHHHHIYTAASGSGSLPSITERPRTTPSKNPLSGGKLFPNQNSRPATSDNNFKNPQNPFQRREELAKLRTKAQTLDENDAPNPDVTLEQSDHLYHLLNEKFRPEEEQRSRLLAENLTLKARLRNVLAFLDLTNATPSIAQARKLLSALEASGSTLPTVDYTELLKDQVRRNTEIAEFVKRKLIQYYQPTLDYGRKKKLENCLRDPYDIEPERHAVKKQQEVLNKWGIGLQFHAEKLRKEINQRVSERGGVASAKKGLEGELLEQQEIAGDSKAVTENLKQQFLLVNATVGKFLKTVGKLDGTLKGKQEKTITSMKGTLCKLASESARLQLQLEAVLRDEKLAEVRYKARYLEAQKTWKSGLTGQSKGGVSDATSDLKNGAVLTSDGSPLFSALEVAKEVARTGLPMTTHHAPVWEVFEKPVVLATEKHDAENEDARGFLGDILHNPGEECVELFNKKYGSESAEER